MQKYDPHSTARAASLIELVKALAAHGIDATGITGVYEEWLPDSGSTTGYRSTGRILAVQLADNEIRPLDRAHPYPWSEQWTPETVSGPANPERYRFSFDVPALPDGQPEAPSGTSPASSPGISGVPCGEASSSSLSCMPS